MSSPSPIVSLHCTSWDADHGQSDVFDVDVQIVAAGRKAVMVHLCSGNFLFR